MLVNYQSENRYINKDLVKISSFIDQNKTFNYYQVN